MTTVGVIVRKSLRHLQLAPVGQAADGSITADTVVEYNFLMAEYEDAMDLTTPDGEPYEHATLGLNDEHPLGDDTASGFSALLAERMAADAGQTEFLSQRTLAEAQRCYGQLLGKFGRGAEPLPGVRRRLRFN